VPAGAPGFSLRLLVVVLCALLPAAVPALLLLDGPLAATAYLAAALLGGGLAWAAACTLLAPPRKAASGEGFPEGDRPRGWWEDQLLRSHGHLRALAARTESAREDERRRIARDVHDQLGQALTGLRFDIAWLGARLEAQPALVAKTREMSALVDEMVQAVRRIAMALRPVVLDDLGFISAVEWQAQEFEARTQIRCEFRTALTRLDLEPTKAITLFRILQEALTNVARHAAARRVVIGLARDNDSLVFTVSDDGAGFDPRALDARHSLGLLGMRERARVVGGSVTVAGRRGKGTEVTVRVPLFVEVPTVAPSLDEEERDP